MKTFNIYVSAYARRRESIGSAVWHGVMDSRLRGNDRRRLLQAGHRMDERTKTHRKI